MKKEKQQEKIKNATDLAKHSILRSVEQSSQKNRQPEPKKGKHKQGSYPHGGGFMQGLNFPQGPKTENYGFLG